LEPWRHAVHNRNQPPGVSPQERDFAQRIAGLLAWEVAYPDSQFAVERTQELILIYQRGGQIASGQIPVLYKIVSLAPMLKNRSPEQITVIHTAANALLEELTKPTIVAPADAKELATRSPMARSVDTLSARFMGGYLTKKAPAGVTQSFFVASAIFWMDTVSIVPVANCLRAVSRMRACNACLSASWRARR